MSTFTLLALAAAASASVLELMFDTGSATSWVTGINCTDTTCINASGFNRTRYNPVESSTSVDLDKPSSILYIDGDVTAGFAFQDQFSSKNSTLDWDQTFLAVNETTWRFITADGLLGLAFSSIAEANTSTLVETLLWKDQLDAPRFALYYGKNYTDGPTGGVLSIGASHEDLYVDGDVAYVPLRKESPYQVWRAPLRSVNVLATRDANSTVTVHNGKAPTTNDPAGSYPQSNTTWDMYGVGTAVFDTGAGRISVPSGIIDAVYFNLGWNVTKLQTGLEVFECKHLNASWALSFTFGESDDTSKDLTFTIRGDEFVREGEQCMPPVDNSGGSSFALLGSHFLRRYYSIFDFGATTVADYQPKVGFGRLKEEYDSQYASA
ncbi:hypothetical protein NHQ30_001714 [Ciborinia camelliae]|nr:hypothetical protein NHQ30_001714 [Ciborinia camelliae]